MPVTENPRVGSGPAVRQPNATAAGRPRQKTLFGAMDGGSGGRQYDRKMLLRAAALATWIAAAPALAQGVEETAEVVAVEVPVEVTTRDGEPLRGLTAESFELYDDGHRRPLSGFEVYDLATAPAEPFAPPPAAARRRFLLLFDLSFSSPAAVLAARLAARDFVLRSLHPHDLVGVAVHSAERGPELLVTFTTDRAQVARALTTLGAPSLAAPAARLDPLRFLVDSPTAVAGELADSLSAGRRAGESAAQSADLLAHLRQLAGSYEHGQRAAAVRRASTWARSLAELASHLGAIAGRKRVLVFSGGFDGDLLLGESGAATSGERGERRRAERGEHWTPDAERAFGSPILGGDFQALLAALRAADCVVHAVDIGAIAADPGALAGGRGASRDALFQLAEGTGGQLHTGLGDLSASLARALRGAAVTYLLTFQPPAPALDGAYHTLEVKPAEGLPRTARLLHRGGYRSPRPFAELHPIERSLLAGDLIVAAAPRRELAVDVLLAPFRTGEAAAYVPVVMEVSGASLLAGATGEALELELYAYASGTDGRLQSFLHHQVRLALPEARANLAGSGVKLYGHLELPPGRYRVRTLARDAASGRSGVASQILEVPDFTAGDPLLLPPFFVDVPQRWILLREPPEVGRRGGVIYPFTVDGEPFMPAARPALRRGQVAELRLVAYHLSAEQATLAGRVSAADGTSQPGGRLRLRRRTAGSGGLEKLVATFEPRDLAPGEYTLQVILESAADGRRGVGSIPFQVVE